MSYLQNSGPFVEQSTDLDAFRFDWAGGEFEMNLRAFGERPNLDIEATLFNDQGEVVLMDNPLDSPDARLVSDLNAGQYTLIVDGVGRAGRNSDYGSLGFYTLEGPELVGDLNENGTWTCEDIDLLVNRIVYQDSPLTILDDFDGYSTGGLDADQTGGVWRFGTNGANAPAGLADDGTTVVPFLDIGTDGAGNQFLSGTSSHGRPDAEPQPNARFAYTSRNLGPATIDDGTARRIAFDVQVTADDRSPVNIGFSTQTDLNLLSRFAGFIQIVPNQFDNAGTGPLGDGVANTFSISARNGATLVGELATGLSVAEWHTIELAIDSVTNTYDVWVGDQLIADDYAFRGNANSGDIITFGFAGLEHQDSLSPVYTDNDGIRLDNLRYGEGDLTRFDLNDDGAVNAGDVDTWLAVAGEVNLASGDPFLYGDANLDGNVDVSDFAIWNANKFTSTAAWCQGDFNADGVTDVSDFSLWNANKFTSAGQLNSAPFRHVRQSVGAEEIARALPLSHDDFAHDHSGDMEGEHALNEQEMAHWDARNLSSKLHDGEDDSARLKRRTDLLDLVFSVEI